MPEFLFDFQRSLVEWAVRKGRGAIFADCGLGKTPMQVALAWLLRRAPNILLIPGTSRVEHLRENLAAAEIDLPADARKELDRI